MCLFIYHVLKDSALWRQSRALLNIDCIVMQSKIILRLLHHGTSMM